VLFVFAIAFLFLFVVFVVGALGENISRRSSSEWQVWLSGVIGGGILGGWVWLACDFAVSIYCSFKRRLS